MPLPKKMTQINRRKLKELSQREEQKFIAEHPRSAEMYARARKSLLGGVPMNWMRKWAGAFPVFVAHAKGAHFTDVDGREYVDLCLGDTGAMTGHSPDVVAHAIAKQVREGITLMLPTEDSIWVADELRRRFWLPYWPFALTANTGSPAIGCPLPESVTEIAMTRSDRARVMWKVPMPSPLAVWTRALAPSSLTMRATSSAWGL